MVLSIIEVACIINSDTGNVYRELTVFLDCICQLYLSTIGQVFAAQWSGAAKRQLLIQLSFLSDLPPFNNVGITVEGGVLEVKNFILQYIHTDTHNYKRYVYKYK